MVKQSDYACKKTINFQNEASMKLRLLEIENPVEMQQTLPDLRFLVALQAFGSCSNFQRCNPALKSEKKQ